MQRTRKLNSKEKFIDEMLQKRATSNKQTPVVIQNSAKLPEETQKESTAIKEKNNDLTSNLLDETFKPKKAALLKEIESLSKDNILSGQSTPENQATVEEPAEVPVLVQSQAEPLEETIKSPSKCNTSEFQSALNNLKKQVENLKERLGNAKSGTTSFDDLYKAVQVAETLYNSLNELMKKYTVDSNMDVKDFVSQSKALLASEDLAELRNPRGDWSFTRVLDALTKGLDTMFEQVGAKTGFHSFFHVKTTTERKVDAIAETLDALKI